MGRLYDAAVSDAERRRDRTVANTALAYASQAWVLPHLRDPIKRLDTIGKGEVAWRNAFTKEFGKRFGLGPCQELADDWFYELCKAHIAEFGLATPAQVLDAIEPVMAPTEDEIRRGWYVDVAMDPDQIREQYGDYHPQEVLDKLVGR